MAHRLSYLLHSGPIPAGMSVLHRCDMPACINPDHLFLGTVLDNKTDSMNKKRHAHGNSHGYAVLNENIIRFARKHGIKPQYLVALYGISYDTAYDAIVGRTWKHI